MPGHSSPIEVNDVFATESPRQIDSIASVSHHPDAGELALGNAQQVGISVDGAPLRSTPSISRGYYLVPRSLYPDLQDGDIVTIDVVDPTNPKE